jgi:hypothetical protein
MEEEVRAIHRLLSPFIQTDARMVKKLPWTPGGQSGDSNTRSMARLPQFAYPENESLAVSKIKASVKELSPEARAYVLAWLVKFYRDDGAMFFPSISQRRKRVTIDQETFWLVKVPTNVA